MNCLNENVTFDNIDKKIIILFFTHVDSSRYIKIKKQNVLVLIRIYDKFIFFVIFIYNSNWKKIKKDLLINVFVVNCFNFVARVFQLKLKKLIKNFIERYVLKKAKTHIYVIEFQKRDLSHVYILIIAVFKNNVNIANVDKTVKTIISDSKKNKKLYNLIFKHIIHKNCLRNANAVCYDKNDNCIKFFSKSLSEIIDLNYFLNYLIYARHVMNCIESTL